MAVLDIVLYPDDPLTKKAVPFDEINADVARLAEDMIETMFEYEGVGLAGPQVGIAKRIFVWCEPDGEPACIVNPILSEFEGREEREEGCLSMPRLYHPIARATRLLVQGLDQFGTPVEFEAKDFLARIMQHETDHLDGILFPDRVDILTRETLLQQWAELRAQLAAEAAGAPRAV